MRFAPFCLRSPRSPQNGLGTILERETSFQPDFDGNQDFNYSWCRIGK